MATVIEPGMGGTRPVRTDHQFFFVSAIVMAGIVVAGFGTQWAMGRSTVHSPVMLHVHGLVFLSWTIFYVVQSGLAAGGSVALHKRLGWAGAVLAPLMVGLGTYMTVMMVRRGATPFFFEPAYFLVMNPLTVLTFGGLLAAAIVNRRRTAWHRRLMFCAMAFVIGPAFGRLLPMPLLVPYAGWAVFAACMMLPLAGVIADRRRTGRVHPAWVAGMATMTVAWVAVTLIAYSPVGHAIYDAATMGSPGARIDPYAFAPSPGAGAPITGDGPIGARP